MKKLHVHAMHKHYIFPTSATHSWTNYLENYLKDITPEACRFTYMTLCIGAWDFGWVWHFGILAIWSRYTRTLLCIHLYIINSVTSSFLMILVTATHGEQWSKLHIEIEIISKQKILMQIRKREIERDDSLLEKVHWRCNTYPKINGDWCKSPPAHQSKKRIGKLYGLYIKWLTKNDITQS